MMIKVNIIDVMSCTKRKLTVLCYKPNEAGFEYYKVYECTYVDPDIRGCLELDEVRGSRGLGKLQVAEYHVRSFLGCMIRFSEPW
jgi:hypothetical protein